jgi:spore coat polysaccharide biosynthesis protein SpsF
MKKGIFIQARLSSSRFPGKMMEKIDGIPLIEYVYNRCKTSEEADEIIVITSIEKSDDRLYEFCKERSIHVFRGPLNNVLERFIMAADEYDCSLIGRVCGDSPFVDIFNLDNMFRNANNTKIEYLRYEQEISGFLSEVIQLKTLKKLNTFELQQEDIEHVTHYILHNKEKFNVDIKVVKDNNYHPLTIDFQDDLLLCNRLIRNIKMVKNKD